MSVVSDAIRSLWLPQIQTVVGRPLKGLGAYVLDQDYQIYLRPVHRRVELSFSEATPLLNAIAFDITRFSTAALESVSDSRPDPNFSKSTAWLLIKTYYAAFFAAHAIARMLGVSYTRFDTKHCNAIVQIAELFHSETNSSSIVKVSNGMYRCEVLKASSTLRCDLLGDGAKSGSHETFWTSFSLLLKQTSNAVLVSRSGVPANNLLASQLIDALRSILNLRGCQGAWLSMVRNVINYQHEFGCWYPYRNPSEKAPVTLLRASRWRDDVITISLTTGREDIHRFQAAALFLVSLCREMAIDMAERTPSGTSFHKVGLLAMLAMLNKTGSVA